MLNQRQIKILQHLANDMDAKEVAEVLNSTSGAINTECQRIREIMEFKRTWACVAEAMRRGWVV